MSKKLRKTWEQRSQERTKQETIKALEKQMKGEKQAEKDVCG
jgi:rRNA-processing protein CGR1